MAVQGARKENPASPPVRVKVELPSGTVEVTDNTARLILFCAKHEAFFNDPDTMGNIVLSFKQGDMQIKQDLLVQV